MYDFDERLDWSIGMVSLKEIASLAGVSLGTVSFVLNGKGDQMRISKETQLKVMETAKQLGYSPNISARRLRSDKDNPLPIIAVLWTLDTRASLISRFFKGIHHMLTKSNTRFELLVQPYEASKLEQVKSLLTGTRFNGAIIANASDDDLIYLENQNLQVPIVLYQRHSEKYSCVHVDSYQSGKQVAQIFASRDHRNAALIVPKVSSQAVHLRKQGFIDGASDHNLRLAPSHILTEAFSEEGGYRAVKEMMKGGALPTAAFFLSDQMAIGALAALNEEGIRVPEDIELVGYDNIESAPFTVPSLSTINLPVEDMAMASVNMLLDILEHRRSEPVYHRFDTEYLARNTCGTII